MTASPAHTEPGDVRALVIPLRSGLPNGDYTVRWRIVSTDGHIISGVFAVGFGAGRPPPQAAEVQTASIDWPFLIARFAYFCGLALVIGGVVFRAAVWRPRRRDARRAAAGDGRPARADPRDAAVHGRRSPDAGGRLGCADATGRRGRRRLVLGGLRPPRARCVGHPGDAVRRGSSAVGSTWRRSSASARPARSRSCAAAAWAPRRSPSPRCALGLWTIIVPGLSGHAGDPGRGALTIAVDALHVGASAIWIGGLAQLVLVVPHATRGLADGVRDRARRQALGRFSNLALGSVIVIAVTGAGRALWEVDAVSQVWTTGYGRTLIVKSVLFAGLIALGYRNRARARPVRGGTAESRRRAGAPRGGAGSRVASDRSPAGRHAGVRRPGRDRASRWPGPRTALAAGAACALARGRRPERPRRAHPGEARLDPSADRRQNGES